MASNRWDSLPILGQVYLRPQLINQYHETNKSKDPRPEGGALVWRL